MIARILIALMAMMVGIGVTGTAALAGGQAAEAVLREDDASEVVVEYEADDMDGGTGGNAGGNTGNNTFNSGTGNSNDGTNSRVTPVSKDRDWSNDDLTKDWTKDGAGAKKRDWSRNHTNDRTRNDTR
jgi:hypothetical protein